MVKTMINEKNLERKLQVAHMGDAIVVEHICQYFKKENNYERSQDFQTNIHMDHDTGGNRDECRFLFGCHGC